MEDQSHHQREVTAVALQAMEGYSFALAGSGAIREHGITNRMTHDIDLFTSSVSVPEFAAAVERMTRELAAKGYGVDRHRQADQFASFVITTPGNSVVEMDLAVDWRAAEPVRLSVGPVLSLEDAVGSKIAAVYGRAEVRDLLDMDAIRQSGRFTDDELIALVREREPGFEMSMFAQQLHVLDDAKGAVRAAAYGVSAEELTAVKGRLASWSAELMREKPAPAKATGIEHREKLEAILRAAGVPEQAIAARLRAERLSAYPPGQRPPAGTSADPAPRAVTRAQPQQSRNYGPHQTP